MPLNRIACPECGAGLKSATGFTPGKTVTCPKCETYFTVEEPEDEPDDRPKKPVRAAVEDDEDDDRPKKKKKKKKRRDDDDVDGRSYKNSPLRFVVLGVLLVVLAVLTYFLYQKRQREAKDAATPAVVSATVVA